MFALPGPTLVVTTGSGAWRRIRQYPSAICTAWSSARAGIPLTRVSCTRASRSAQLPWPFTPNTYSVPMRSRSRASA